MQLRPCPFHDRKHNNAQVKSKNQEMIPIHPRLRCSHLFLECTGKTYGYVAD
jgi:hypothetical protein